jgi:hypothetical protein
VWGGSSHRGRRPRRKRPRLLLDWLTPPAGQQPLSRPAHNFRLAPPLAAIGRRELARIDSLHAQRREQTALLGRMPSGGMGGVLVTPLPSRTSAPARGAVRPTGCRGPVHAGPVCGGWLVTS